jgi:prolipoprotein diacylglyceryltransferase
MNLLSHTGFCLDRTLSGEWYSLCYALAFLIGGLVFWREGRRQGASMATWLLMGSAAVFLMILGTRFGTMSSEEWQYWWSNGALLHSGRKTAVGGLLLGFLGLWLVRVALGYRQPMWDAFALYLPLTLIVHRLGCLLAGCCSGRPAELPWAVSYYGPGWLRDVHQWAGYIPVGAPATLPVHPVPVYEMISCAILLWVLIRLRRRRLRPGWLILLSIGSMLTVRFFLEFLREPMGNFSMADTWMGLKTVQWICLFLLGLVGLRAFRLRADGIPLSVVNDPIGHRHWLVLLAMLGLTLQEDRFFAGIERMVLLAHLVPVLFILSRQAWHATCGGDRLLFMRMAMPVTLILLFTGMTSEIPGDPNPASTRQTSIYLRAHRMTLPDTQYPCLRTEQGCIGDYCAEQDLERPHGPTYSVLQLGAEHVIPVDGRPRSYVLGGDLQFDHYLNRSENKSFTYGLLHVYGGLEGNRYLGARLGLQAGRTFLADLRPSAYPTVLLSSRFWVGYRPWAVLQVGVNDLLPIGLNTFTTYALIDANIGALAPRYLGRLRFGMTKPWGDFSTAFGNMDFRINQELVLSPTVSYMMTIDGSPFNQWGLGLGVKYTFSDR